MKISTKTGKITLFCGCKGAPVFLFLRAERRKLPQNRVKLPFFVEIASFLPSVRRFETPFLRGRYAKMRILDTPSKVRQNG